MNEHPYYAWNLAAGALITASIVGLLYVISAWIWEKRQRERQQRRWDADKHFTPDEDLEAEHRLLLAQEGDQNR